MTAPTWSVTKREPERIPPKGDKPADSPGLRGRAVKSTRHDRAAQAVYGTGALAQMAAVAPVAKDQSNAGRISLRKCPRCCS